MPSHFFLSLLILSCIMLVKITNYKRYKITVYRKTEGRLMYVRVTC